MKSDRTYREAWKDWMRSIIDTEDGNLILGTLLMVSAAEFERIGSLDVALSSGLVEPKAWRDGELYYGFTAAAIDTLAAVLLGPDEAAR